MCSNTNIGIGVVGMVLSAQVGGIIMCHTE